MAQDSNHDHHEHRGSSVSTYVTVALILAVITYLEFAIVEFEIGWLSSGAILFWLILMSVIKFLFVIWYFMHLKDDETTYSGFFGSGMAIALGTFIVLGLLFTAPASLNRVRAQADLLGGSYVAVAEDDHGGEADEGHGGHGGLSDAELELIESDGYSREIEAVLDTPRPKSQGISLTLPAAPEVEVDIAPAPMLFGAAVSEDPAATTETGEGTEDTETADTAEATSADAASEASDASSGAAEAAETTASDDTAEAASDTADEPVAQAADPLDYDAALGEQTYGSCVGCHQANGEGIAGVFPPLADWMPTLVGADGAREYLANAMLYGLQGEIVIDGQSYNGVMPPWQQLSDAQIAAVLNHELTSWGNAEQLPDDYTPFTAEEIGAARGAGLSANDVYQQRQELDLP